MRSCLSLLLISILLFATPWPSFAQERGPLTELEKREVLARLHELRIARAELEVLHDYVDKDEAQDKRERELAARELANEKRATALAERERDLEKTRADQLDALLKAASKKPSAVGRALKWGLPAAAIAGLGAWVALGR